MILYMKSSKILNILTDGNIVIPLYLLRIFKNFNIDALEFLFLMYLYNKGNEIIFNPERFSCDLGIDISEVMNFVSVLSEKGFIKIDVKKNEKGFMEDVILIDGFYDKLKMNIVNDVNDSKESSFDSTTIYDVIEKEFGRTLSPIEYEIIKAWEESQFSEDIIKEAVKEAVFNGVSNLKYIDKILFEWSKKGIKTINDVEENRKKHRNLNSSNKDINDNIDMDIVDWNWFDDE